MNNINVRNARGGDSFLLCSLAQKCYPLDVHTYYTYWVQCNLFADSCFILEYNGETAGFITALKTDDCVFVWQIGVLEKYRLKGYSNILIDAVRDYAIKQNKNIKVSIAEENLASFNAFHKYCKNNNLPFESVGLVTVNDMNGKLYCDQEVIYKITCV